MTFRDYILGKPEDFYNFVEGISKKDKIGLITHVDLDGIASAVFLQKILKSKNFKTNFIEFIDYSSDALKPISNKNFNVLFFTDWKADNYSGELEALRKKGKVFVIDHHPFNENLKDKNNIIKTQDSYCSSHAIFDLAKKYIKTKNLEWLLYPAIIFDYCMTDSEVADFVREKYPDFTKENAFNSASGKLGEKINSALIYYKSNLKEAHKLVLEKNIKELSKTQKIIKNELKLWYNKYLEEAEFYPEKKLYFYYGNPKYSMTSPVTNQLSYNNPDFTFVFVSDNLDKKEFLKLSSRNQTGKIDLNLKMKKCIENFDNAVAGGHPKATGGSFMKKDLEKFKENLLKEF